MNNFESDVIVIGAGTAGSVAAFMAAKKGLKTIILERKAKEDIGNKVCGDGIGSRHLEYLPSIGIKLDKNEIVHSYPEEAHIISPDNKHVDSFEITGKLTILNRHAFGQTLLSAAVDAGAILYEKMTLKSVSRNEINFEVRVKENSDLFRAKTIIDASGINSWIREKSGFFPQAHLDWRDIYACYREVVRTPKKIGTPIVKFEFNQSITQGGYIWYFDRTDNEVNMGLGIPRHRIASLSPKTAYMNNISEKVPITEVLEGRGGIVPTRHLLANLTNSQGIWLTGDAGLIVNPLHGGGIGSSIYSGHEAAISAFEFLTDNKSPWNYNVKMFENYGKRYAILDFFRLLLHKITDVELNTCLHDNLLPIFYLFHAKYPVLEMICEKYEEFWENASIKLLQNLPNHIERMNKHLKEYPKEPGSTATEWAKEYEQIYQSYQEANGLSDTPI